MWQPHFAPLNEGVPGEPGVAVQSEPPSVWQQEAPGEETEKGLREARREGTKGRKAPEGSQVGQEWQRLFPSKEQGLEGHQAPLLMGLKCG